jgi:hypothetical protein
MRRGVERVRMQGRAIAISSARKISSRRNPEKVELKKISETIK